MANNKPVHKCLDESLRILHPLILTHFLYPSTLRVYLRNARCLTRQFLTPQFLTPQFLTPQFLTRQFLTRQFLTHQFLTRQFLTRQFLTHQFLTHQFLTRQFLTRQFALSRRADQTCPCDRTTVCYRRFHRGVTPVPSSFASRTPITCLVNQLPIVTQWMYLTTYYWKRTRPRRVTIGHQRRPRRRAVGLPPHARCTSQLSHL